MDIKYCITPGIRMIIEFPDLYRYKFSSYFRGLKENKYVLIDRPIHKQLPLQIEPNVSAMVRFINFGRAFGFIAEVIGQVQHPHPLIFLDYPSNLESSNLRKEERYPVSLPTSFSTRKSGEASLKPVEGEIVNISRGGCSLISPIAFESGTELFMYTDFPQAGPEKDLPATIRSVIELSGEMFQLGLSFQGLFDASLENVEKYLKILQGLRVRSCQEYLTG